MLQYRASEYSTPLHVESQPVTEAPIIDTLALATDSDALLLRETRLRLWSYYGNIMHYMYRICNS